MPTAAAPMIRQRTRMLRGELDGSRWEMAVRPPAAQLRPYVHGDYVGYTEWSGPMNRRREFPGPFVVMILEFGPPLRVYDAGNPRRLSSHRGGFVVGLGDTFAVCEHDGFQHGVQINLTAIGARLLFGLPMSELSGQTVSVRDLLPARHRDLGQQLQDATDWDERFDLLDGALADGMGEAFDRTRIVSWAVRRIEQTGGRLDMRALARELGYSRKHVITLFRDQVGIPPKLLARLVRFDRLVQHLRRGGPGTWAELAVEFGYYDQAHLVRDVRQFTGVTPSEVRPLTADPLSQFC
jgi:AraC-like DNA-binding protein